MKKLLAFVLCVAMIASMCVFSTSAATYWTKVKGHGWHWDSENAYGYLTSAVDSRPGNDVGYEYDIVHLADAPKDGAVIPSGIGFSTSAGYIYVARTGVLPGYSTKELDQLVPYSGAVAAGPTCQQHVKVEFTGSGMTTWIDGVRVDHKDGVTCTNSRWFFQYEGSAAIDNLRVYTPSTGNTVAFDDFEGGGNYLAGDGGGSRFAFEGDAYDMYGFIPGDKVGITDDEGPSIPLVTSNGIPVEDAALEFDIAFIADSDKGVCLVAPDVDGGRLLISRYGVGIGNAYGDAETVKGAVTALPSVADAGWKNQHHVKITSTSEGIKVWMDGSEIYTASAKFTNAWTGTSDGKISWLNLAGHQGKCAIDNLRLYVLSTDQTLATFDGTSLKDGMGSAGYGSKFYLDTVPNFIEKFPIVNMITGYTQLEYNGDLADKQVYTMDLALIPDENGVAELTVWGGSNGTMDRAGIKLDANTGKATVGVACDNTGRDGHTDHGSFTAPVEFNWGAGTYANMHKVVFTFDGTVTINIDGTDVYNSGLTVGTNGNSFAVMMADKGVCPIDNFSLVSGNVNLSSDFEEGSAGIGGGALKTIYPCGDNHTFSKFYATTTYPTCTDNGVGTAICEICGDAETTRSIDALGHNFTNNWDDANHVTDTSREYYCRRCNMAVATSLPSADDYNGTYYTYADFKNKDMTEEVLGIEFGVGGYMSDDGYYSADTAEKNYHQLNGDAKLNPTRGYVHSIDLRLNKLTSNSDSEKYGNVFYFWCAGDNGMVAQAGVDFATGEVFIVPTTPGTFDEKRVDLNITAGEWHSYAVRFITDWDELTATLELIVDGKSVITIGEDDIEMSAMVIGAPEGANSSYPLLRFFGADVSFSNYVQGSYDFEWTTGADLLGDVNGDGKVNMIDLLRAKKFVVGLVGAEDVVMKNSDLDSKRDGITVTDIALLKKLISTL